MYSHIDKVYWKECFFYDICNSNVGGRLTKTKIYIGKIPFIGEIDSNNSVANFVRNINKSVDKNVFVGNYIGFVMENFYHLDQCIFSDNVKSDSIKNMYKDKTNTVTCY